MLALSAIHFYGKLREIPECNVIAPTSTYQHLQLTRIVSLSGSAVVRTVWSFTLSSDFSFHSIISLACSFVAYMFFRHFRSLCSSLHFIETFPFSLSLAIVVHVHACLGSRHEFSFSKKKKRFYKKIDFVFHFARFPSVPFVFLCLYQCKMKDHITMDKQMRADAEEKKIKPTNNRKRKSLQRRRKVKRAQYIAKAIAITTSAKSQQNQFKSNKMKSSWIPFGFVLDLVLVCRLCAILQWMVCFVRTSWENGAPFRSKQQTKNRLYFAV